MELAPVGALGMLAFGLGTVPALVAVDVAGQAAGARLQDVVAKGGPAVMLANAGPLIMLAVRSLGA